MTSCLCLYGCIVRNSISCVPNIPFQVAALLIEKLADKIFHRYRNSNIPVTPTHSPTLITEDELDGLYYLLDYVVCKCLKKSPQGSEALKILEEITASDYSGE